MQYYYYSEGQFKVVKNPITGTQCRTGQLNHLFVEQALIDDVWIDLASYPDVAGEGCRFREGARSAAYVVDVELLVNGFAGAENTGWENIGGAALAVIPVVSSAVIEAATHTLVAITFNTALDENSVPATAAFTLAGKTVSSVAITGAVVTLTVTPGYVSTDVVTVNYTKPGANPLKELVSGGEVATFADQAVTNNSLNYFVTTWQTENAGSATKTIVIPTTGAGYDFYADWGDGGAEEHITGTAPATTHTYATTGIKTVMIRGTFPRIYFAWGGDKLKLLTIAHWGDIAWGSMYLAFAGCANLTGTYTDAPNTSATAAMNLMFHTCPAFNSPVNFNTANVTTMISMFEGCTAFNQSVASFNTVKVTDMNTMFKGCAAFNQDVSGFNVAKVTNMTTMFTGATAFSTANYDALLISWGAQAVGNTVTLSVVTAKYTAGGAAAAARAHLVLATGSGGHGWTITDGGTA